MSKQKLRSIFYSGDNFRTGWEFIFYIVITAATVAVILTPLVLVLSAIGLSPQIGGPITGWASISGSLVTLAAGYSAFLLGTHFTQKFVRHSSLSNLGMRFDKAAAGNFVAGFGLGSAIIIISVLLSWIFGYYKFSGFSWQFRTPDVLIAAIVMVFVAKIQPALVEEVVFRGYLFQMISSRWNIRVAVLLTSLLFGLLHLTSFDETTTWWMAIISTFLAGLIFAQAYMVRMSLWLPIGIHYAWHIMGRLLGDSGGAAENAILVVSNVAQKPIITSPTGGGAGIFDLAGVAIVSLILWRVHKRKSRNG